MTINMERIIVNILLIHFESITDSDSPSGKLWICVREKNGKILLTNGESLTIIMITPSTKRYNDITRPLIG